MVPVLHLKLFPVGMNWWRKLLKTPEGTINHALLCIASLDWEGWFVTTQSQLKFLTPLQGTSSRSHRAY